MALAARVQQRAPLEHRHAPPLRVGKRCAFVGRLQPTTKLRATWCLRFGPGGRGRPPAGLVVVRVEDPARDVAGGGTGLDLQGINWNFNNNIFQDPEVPLYMTKGAYGTKTEDHFATTMSRVPLGAVVDINVAE